MRAVMLGTAVVFAVSAFVNLRSIDRAEFVTDEGRWISVSLKTWKLFRTGDWDSPEWKDIDATWGYVNPPISKYMMGAALSAQGADWEWSIGESPPGHVLVAARRASAILGAIGSLGLLWIGLRSLTVPAATLAALMLAVSPFWIIASRTAMTDVYGTVLAILGVGAFLPALDELGARRRWGRILSWITASGLLSGLAVGAKLNAASTPVALGVCLLLLLLQELFVPVDRRLGGVSRILAAGTLFAAAAIGIFVALNPYLHEDAWQRFWGIVAHWRHATEDRAARGIGSRPEEEGIRLLISKLVAPARWPSPVLVIPILLAFAARRTRLRSSPELTRLFGWLLLVPVALGIGFMRSPVMHAWLPWIGMLGAVLTLASSTRGEIAARVNVRNGLALLLWGATATYFVWRMTHTSTMRYYLPPLPFLCLLAGYGLASLRDDVGCGGSRWPTGLLYVAVATGILSVIATFPEYLGARIKNIATEPGLPRLLHWICAASLVASIASGITTLSRRPADASARSARDAPDPRRAV